MFNKSNKELTKSNKELTTTDKPSQTLTNTCDAVNSTGELVVDVANRDDVKRVTMTGKSTEKKKDIGPYHSRTETTAVTLDIKKKRR